MSPVGKWFERRFEFAFPVDLHPNLCARVRGTPARLEEVFRDQTRTRMLRKLDEKWSAQEHAGHLLDLEPLWRARVDNYLAGSSELAAADLSNRQTDKAQHNLRGIEEILGDFRRLRMRLAEKVGRLDPALLGRSLQHPRLKQPMRLVDHLYFVAEHDDHHLARIWELLHGTE